MKKPHRVVFHEITKNAVEEAIANPRDIDRNLVDAQQTRRIVDRLVGYTLSPLIGRKVRRGLSAGRVQSVAVRLVVDTGIHHYKWTRKQAIDYFVEQDGEARGELFGTWAPDGRAADVTPLDEAIKQVAPNGVELVFADHADGEDDVLRYRSVTFETHQGLRGNIQVAITPTREVFAKNKLWFAYFR